MRYVIHFGPETLHIDMEGIFTFMDSRSFHRMMFALAETEGKGHIKVNLGKLTNMDCTGLRLLMQAHDFAKKAHRTLTFVAPKGQVLAHLTRASDHNLLNIAA